MMWADAGISLNGVADRICCTPASIDPGKAGGSVVLMANAASVRTLG